MTITELRKMIEIAETLGHGDTQLCVDQSRDGKTHYQLARAKFIKEGSDPLDDFMLVVIGQ